jgi:steroid 5-alpha reductase family enzyme
MIKIKRIHSYFIITLCYIAAAVLGIWLYWSLPFVPWLSLLIADLAATFFIWLMSQLLKNASVYDPYWSVQPPIILGLTLFFMGEFNIGSIFLVLVVSFWGARLSANWMITFDGLHAQDWRYDLLEKKSGRFFPLVNLFGIQIMPTLIVYACLLPGFYYLMRGGGFNAVTLLGLVLIFGGTVLELVADYQLQTFRANRQDRSELFREGLWRHSRHPNYLGEITVWWGVYFVMLSCCQDIWFLGVGALVNTCLFLFISIPMAEKHLAAYKKDYEAYRAETRILLPLPKFRR